MAMSPLANEATPATAIDGEFPPPKSWSQGPLPKDTITYTFTRAFIQPQCSCILDQGP